MRLFAKSLTLALGSVAVFFGFVPASPVPAESVRLVAAGGQQCAPEKAQEDIVFISCGGFF